MIQHATDASETARGVGPLDVQLAVDVESTSGCPLRGRDTDGVRQSMNRSAAEEPETCQVVVEDGGGTDYERTDIGDTCPCSVMEGHDCVAEIEAVRDGRLLYSVVVPDREELRAVVADLREDGASVSLERIRTDPAAGGPRADGVALTAKQREVLSLAIEAGYYEQPREASLSDLADELDVTPSAVSQRLNAVERKLVCERARDFDLQ
ncbi:helix-turn-helix domain-containing protein [Halostella litorea]|uniref:helix-turn-helix domain-containing protein n=1 Tax=Halostella litorea TaxID=2528831 RepID=UPI001092C3DC|nr:helix-turn-helix domain-containing protein [Halostella litorea]